MGLFSKPEYKTVYLDYKFYERDGLPCIEAFGDVFGEKKYCTASYTVKTSEHSMWEDGRYDKLAEKLRANQGQLKIEVMIKMKKEMPVDFKIDLNRLAATVGDPNILHLELAGWGFSDKPEPLES